MNSRKPEASLSPVESWGAALSRLQGQIGGMPAHANSFMWFGVSGANSFTGLSASGIAGFREARSQGRRGGDVEH